MKRRLLASVMLACIISPCAAQEPAQDRRLLALPYVMEQRNLANDALALCQADAQSSAAELRRQLAAANAKLSEMTAQLEALKESKP